MNQKTNFISRRFIVTGKVQGVFFRASTKKQADKRGLCGYAKNLTSGQVEVLVQGRLDAISELESWLHRGPPLAKVSSVIEVDGQLERILDVFSVL